MSNYVTFTDWINCITEVIFSTQLKSWVFGKCLYKKGPNQYRKKLDREALLITDPPQNSSITL